MKKFFLLFLLLLAVAAAAALDCLAPVRAQPAVPSRAGDFGHARPIPAPLPGGAVHRRRRHGAHRLVDSRQPPARNGRLLPRQRRQRRQQCPRGPRILQARIQPPALGLPRLWPQRGPPFRKRPLCRCPRSLRCGRGHERQIADPDLWQFAGRRGRSPIGNGPFRRRAHRARRVCFRRPTWRAGGIRISPSTAC